MIDLGCTPSLSLGLGAGFTVSCASRVSLAIVDEGEDTFVLMPVMMFTKLQSFTSGTMTVTVPLAVHAPGAGAGYLPGPAAGLALRLGAGEAAAAGVQRVAARGAAGGHLAGQSAAG